MEHLSFQILEKLLRHTTHSLSPADIKGIADEAHGFVGADLAAVCKEGRSLPMEPHVTGTVDCDGKFTLVLVYLVEMLMPDVDVQFPGTPVNRGGNRLYMSVNRLHIGVRLSRLYISINRMHIGVTVSRLFIDLCQ